jgi:hypothetical protein
MLIIAFYSFVLSGIILTLSIIIKTRHSAFSVLVLSVAILSIAF